MYKGSPTRCSRPSSRTPAPTRTPTANAEVEVDYIDLFADVYETYGRTVRVEIIEASGGPDDATAAQADALTGDRARSPSRSSAARPPTRGPRRSPTPGSSASACGTRRERREGRGQRSLLVADRPDPGAGRRPPRRDGRQAARRQAGRVRRRRGDARARSGSSAGSRPRPRPTSTRRRNDAFEEQLAADYGGEVATRFTYLFDPSQGRGHRHHGHRPHEGGGRDHGHHQHRPAHPGQHHQGGHHAELLPGVGHRPERARRHHHLRPHLRPGAVGARLRPRAHRRPGRARAHATRTTCTTGTTARRRP